MKATLTFNLPEDREEFNNALEGCKSKAVIEEIWNKVFRPAHKHGYVGKHDRRLNELLESDTPEGMVASEVIDMLGDIYQELLKEENEY